MLYIKAVLKLKFFNRKNMNPTNSIIRYNKILITPNLYTFSFSRFFCNTYDKCKRSAFYKIGYIVF